MPTFFPPSHATMPEGPTGGRSRGQRGQAEQGLAVGEPGTGTREEAAGQDAAAAGRDPVTVRASCRGSQPPSPRIPQTSGGRRAEAGGGGGHLTGADVDCAMFRKPPEKFWLLRLCVFGQGQCVVVEVVEGSLAAATPVTSGEEEPPSFVLPGMNLTRETSNSVSKGQHCDEVESYLRTIMRRSGPSSL